MKYISMILLLLLNIAVLYSCKTIEVIEDTVDLNQNSEKPIVLLHVSDLHIRRNRLIYTKLSTMINQINPDVLIFTGDSVDKNKHLPFLDTFLKKITVSSKKYAILGNHEYGGDLDIRLLDNTYAKNDVLLLVNEYDKSVIKNVEINLFGIDDWSPALKNFSCQDGAVNLILIHCPEYFDTIKKQFSDKKILVFAGHTHGGQITCFGKPIVLPRRCGSYVKGKYSFNNVHLYVSKGIGTTGIPIRIFAKPDIIKINIQ